MHFQIDSPQDLTRVITVGSIRKANVRKPNSVRETRKWLCAGLLEDDILGVHELKKLGRCTQRLLEAVVKHCELTDRVVHAKDGGNKGDKGTQGKFGMSDLIASQEQQQGDCNRSEYIHQGRTDCGGRNRAQIGMKQALRRL